MNLLTRDIQIQSLPLWKHQRDIPAGIGEVDIFTGIGHADMNIATARRSCKTAGHIIKIDIPTRGPGLQFPAYISTLYFTTRSRRTDITFEALQRYIPTRSLQPDSSFAMF